LRAYERRRDPRVVPCGVTEESQLNEMNAAIRAQRERGAVPKSMLPPEEERIEPAPPPPEPPKRGFFARLLGRS
jgi:hypothetical protein